MMNKNINIQLIYYLKHRKNNELKVLLEDPSIDINYQDSWPIQLAAKYADLAIFKLLIEHHANFAIYKDVCLTLASESGNLDVVNYCLENGADVHVNMDDPLRYSSANGHLTVVQLLLKYGANIYADNNYSIQQSSKLGQLHIIQYFIEQGLDPYLAYQFGDYQVKDWCSKYINSKNLHHQLDITLPYKPKQLIKKI